MTGLGKSEPKFDTRKQIRPPVNARSDLLNGDFDQITRLLADLGPDLFDRAIRVSLCFRS